MEVSDGRRLAAACRSCCQQSKAAADKCLETSAAASKAADSKTRNKNTTCPEYRGTSTVRGSRGFADPAHEGRSAIGRIESGHRPEAFTKQRRQDHAYRARQAAQPGACATGPISAAQYRCIERHRRGYLDHVEGCSGRRGADIDFGRSKLYVDQEE